VVLKRLSCLIFLVLFVISILSGCNKNSVVIYTSVDQNFSSVLFEKFEKDTGIKVEAKYDTEASKTTGMVQTLISEKSNPRADVFWNGEIAQTLVLKDNDVLGKYISPKADKIPQNFKDADGTWTAFGGRARVFIVNTELLDKKDYPVSVVDYFSGKYPSDKICIARPLSGTTYTQAGAFYALWGNEKGKKFYSDIIDKGIRVVEGNSVVRDMVAEGSMLWGLTDTDDALGAIEKDAKVDIVFPDQQEDGMGTLIIPNSVALVKGSTNADNAKIFIDYLLSVEIEKYLIEIGWCQVGVRDTGAETPINIEGLKSIDISFENIFRGMEAAKDDLQELFVK
jgi:iron(III) transport system substrate-binding protein